MEIKDTKITINGKEYSLEEYKFNNISFNGKEAKTNEPIINHIGVLNIPNEDVLSWVANTLGIDKDMIEIMDNGEGIFSIFRKE